MPRLARTVFAAVPHHITQRGNRRENVFFNDADCAAYLEWLADYCARYEVAVLAYCLMTNHIHVVAVPQAEDALQKVFRPPHTRYAQRINLPCGAEKFVRKLERQAKQMLHFRPRGRPKKA